MNFRRNIAATLLLMVSVAWAGTANAAKRVALVIGNNTYATLSERCVCGACSREDQRIKTNEDSLSIATIVHG